MVWIAVWLLLTAGVLMALFAVDGEEPPGDALVLWRFPEAADRWLDYQIKRIEHPHVLRVETLGPDPQLFSPPIQVEGPVQVWIRARFQNGNEARVYWRELAPSLVETPFSADAEVLLDVQHDAVWRTMRALVLTDRKVVQLRFDPGHAPGWAEIAWIAVTPLPQAAAAAGTSALPQTVSIHRGGLTLTLAAANHQWTLEDRRSGLTWRSTPALSAILSSVQRRSGSRLELTFNDLSTGFRHTATMELVSSREVVFTLDGSGDGRLFGMKYPTFFSTDWTDGQLVFTNRSCGQLVDQDDPHYPQRSFGAAANLGLDMPWFGVCSRRSGDGAMLLLDTPTDAAIDLIADADRRWWPQVRWLGVRDGWGYPRVLRFLLTSDGYVGMAHTYRQRLLRAHGIKPLSRKIADKPAVAKLRGAAALWGAWINRRPADFAEQAAAHGIQSGLLYSYKGQCTPDEVERQKRLGFIVAEYGNLDDVLPRPQDHHHDDIERVAARDRNGRPMKGWLTFDGKLQYYRRSTAEMLSAFRRIFEPLHTQAGYDGRFMDVVSCIDLYEDWHPDRGFDRRKDLQYRRQLFEYINRLRVVLGGEHGKYWNADLLDYTEGALSASFWWQMPGGHLRKVASLDEVTDAYRRYGMNPATRIPLWDLVYHDSLVTTWYWGDGNGYFYDIAPEWTEARDAWTILHAQMPMLWIDFVNPGQTHCFGWDRHRSRMLRTIRETCHVQAALFGRTLRRHEFMSKDCTLQRNVFDGGWVVVNLSDRPQDYRVRGRMVRIAPWGHLVEAPGLRQQRILVDGQPLAVIEAPRWFSVETPVRRRVGAVVVCGLCALWPTEGGMGLLVESQQPVQIDGAALPWRVRGVLTLQRLDENGKATGAPLPVSRQFEIPPGDGICLWRLTKR